MISSYLHRSGAHVIEDFFPVNRELVISINGTEALLLVEKTGKTFASLINTPMQPPMSRY